MLHEKKRNTKETDNLYFVKRKLKGKAHELKKEKRVKI